MVELDYTPAHFAALQEEINLLREQLDIERTRRIEAEMKLGKITEQGESSGATTAAIEAAKEASGEAPQDFRPDSSVDVPLGHGVDPAHAVKSS